MRVLLTSAGHSYGGGLSRALAELGVEMLACGKIWYDYLPDRVPTILELAPDLIHLQWPEALYGTAEAGRSTDQILAETESALTTLRAAGIRLVWVMHNLLPHYRWDESFQRAIYSLYAGASDGVIHHSRWGEELARQTYAYAPGARHRVIHHGTFRGDQDCTLSQAEARAALGHPSEARVLLSVGDFRPDKRFHLLVEAIGCRPGEQSNDLLILVGTGHARLVEEIQRLAATCSNVHLAGWLSWESLAVHARAADLLVFAHGGQHLTSAGPHLSYTYLLPQVTVDAGYAREILGEGGFYFVDTLNSVASLQSCLERITPAAIERARTHLAATRDAFTWPGIARQTYALYQEILS